MRIHVKLYSALKSYAPDDQSEFELTLKPGTTIADIHILLQIPEGDHVALINGRRSDLNAKLTNGDTVVFLPPISGG